MDTFKKIGKYKYTERHCLGQGSFGKVFQGFDQSGRRVAIKKIQQRMIATDPYLKQSLSTEIAIMKKLKHRNIVQLIDTLITANSIYLILEYCKDGDLKHYSTNKRFSQEQALKILRQLIQGFYVIVNQGIIHRDLKPANILVHQGTFKVCDFGFAKYFGQLNRMVKTCVGTPIYMSPQVLKQKPYTSKSDIWSLGVMYYQILFGKLPFLGKSQNQIFQVITRAKLVIPNCTEESYVFLKNALVIDQQQRWDWNRVFQHFDARTSKQKPGFYQDVIKFFKKGSSQDIENKKMVKTPSIQNQRRQNRNESFNDRGNNFKYNPRSESGQKQQDYQPKTKHNKMAKNIFAQDDAPLLPFPERNRPNFAEQQQHRVQPNLHHMTKVRQLYTIATHFVFCQSTYTPRIYSFSLFTFSLTLFALNQYAKITFPSGQVNQLTKLARMILQQQKQILENVLKQPRTKNIQNPYKDMKAIQGMVDILKLQGGNILQSRDIQMLDRLVLRGDN